MVSSLSSKYITVKKFPPVVRAIFFKSDSSLPAVDNKYSFTRTRNTLASLITLIESLEPSSYLYNLSDNGKGSLCELFRLEICVFLSILKTCDPIRQKKINGKSSISIEKDKWITFLNQFELSNVKITTSKTSIAVDNKQIRKNMTFIRIGTKSLSSYTKATT